MNTMHTRGTLLALLLSVPGLARAVPEAEINSPVADAQMVEITDITVDGVATTGAIVDGVIGVVSGPAVKDLDFFRFTGREGDVVTFDIDGGFGGLRNVDTIVAVFGPAPTYQLLSQNDDGSPVDAGSRPVSSTGSGSNLTRDSHIANYRLPADGTYTVGISGWPRSFSSGGTVASTSTGSNGDYTLIISGVTPSVQQISIEIKPGSGDVAPINPKAKGRVPVALLGSGEFSVDDVDTGSLTFGHSGDEASLAKCGTPSDVNGDLWPDMVCHFENQAARFAPTDDQAILRGRKDDGGKFEGRGWLKVVPVKSPD